MTVTAPQYSEQPRLLRAREVAAYMGLSVSQVYAWIAADVLPVVRLGSAVRVDRAALDRWLDQQRREAGQ